MQPDPQKKLCRHPELNIQSVDNFNLTQSGSNCIAAIPGLVFFIVIAPQQIATERDAHHGAARMQDTRRISSGASSQETRGHKPSVLVS